MRSGDYNKNIITEFINQLRYSEYTARYKLKMMVYYAFSQSEFYRKKFEGKLDLDKKLNIAGLPVLKKAELKSIFPGKEIIPNYYQENYGIFRTSSCGSEAFLYARPLESTRYLRMASCFLNTGRWQIDTPWLKLTALNCLDTVEPLIIEKFRPKPANNSKSSKSEIIIPPSEDFLKEPYGKIKHIYNLIRNSSSRLIHANPSYLKMLLHRMRKENLNLSGRYAVNSTYEILLPSTKRLVEKYLNCDIYDQYGCSETGPISFTCKFGNYHIFGNSVNVEVVPAEDLGRNDIGRVIVTDLENKVMPFVRYFTGDFAYIEDRKDCKCDLRTPLMGRIVGREEEVISYKGKTFFPLELDSAFSDLSNILIYQVIFEDGRFFVKIVLETKSKKIDKDYIRSTMSSLLCDKKCPIEITLVESILPSRRGKYRTVIVK